MEGLRIWADRSRYVTVDWYHGIFAARNSRHPPRPAAMSMSGAPAPTPAAANGTTEAWGSNSRGRNIPWVGC